MEFKKAWIKTKNALLVLLVACVGLGASSTCAWGNTAQSGYELDYFHTYRAARTYAIQLQNGLAATFDFRQGTATLYFGPQQISMPLNQAFLQAANGNSNLATRMYNQMYSEITVAHSDTIIKSTGTHGAGVNAVRTLSVGPGGAAGIGDQNDSMWGWPDPGECWPVPVPCDQWPDGPSGPGLTYWFNTPFGDDPLTSQPPNPDNCAPGDVDCKIWENNRKNACGHEVADSLATSGALYVTFESCGSAVVSGGTLTPVCVAAALSYVGATINETQDFYTCIKPYPGP